MLPFNINMQFNNNLTLSIQFDQEKKFLLCGELVNFHLKLTSPDFNSDTIVTKEFVDFIERIGAAVESIEITEEFTYKSRSSHSNSNSFSASSSSSLNSLKGRKMKSVESLSNLLRDSTRESEQTQTHPLTHSKDSQNSQQSMSSVRARRFNSLSPNRSSNVKAFWSEEEGAVLVPLEAFIDSEIIGSNCNKATAKFKVSLNELIPLDVLESLGFNDYNANTLIDHFPGAKSSHKLQKIGQAETSLIVLRPLEVSLRTHKLVTNQVIIQLNVEFNHEDHTLNGNIEIQSVEIILSDSFTSRNQSSLLATDSKKESLASNLNFKITPLSSSQVPFVFEMSPQDYSLLFNWTPLLNNSMLSILQEDDFRLRVELKGKLSSTDCKSHSEILMSFESSVPISNLFPTSLTTISENSIYPQISSIKLIACDRFKVFKPIQIEIYILNPDKEIKSFTIDILPSFKFKKTFESQTSQVKSPLDLNSEEYKKWAVDNWFKMEKSYQCPAVLLLNPLTPLKLENIPSGGCKPIRLQLVPVRRGIINLTREFVVRDGDSGKILKNSNLMINAKHEIIIQIE